MGWENIQRGIWTTFNSLSRPQVSDLIKESRQALADSLFSWTCQSPLSKDDTLALIGHLETVTAQADGSLDSVNLALVMALLYCLDVSFVEQGTEDREGENMLNTYNVNNFNFSWFSVNVFLLQLVKNCVLCSFRSAPGTAVAD